MSSEDRERVLLQFKTNRYLAHQVLFAHRHFDPTPPFHREMINLWHSPASNVILMAFRGSAKSTISEEGFIIQALYQEFHNGLVLGENEERAVERLQAIKWELENNEMINYLFGSQTLKVNQATKIVLPNGVCIQALGSGQSMRGMKYLIYRPDRILVDDVEGDRDAFTETQRKATRSWFLATVLPALATGAHIRMTATPLDAESLPLTLGSLSDWKTMLVPIKYIAPDGEWVSSWPDKYSMQWIQEREDAYFAMGNVGDFSREYMCQAVADSDKPFKAEHFRAEIKIQTWEPVYCMYDPARTVNRTSAHTGKAVWSWIGNRLIVWESGGYFWLPNEIIEDIFRVNSQYNPVLIGVEQDGLSEWLLQPIRQKALDRQIVLPVEGKKAPRGKIDFIKGLQPFFNAGEIIFVGDSHDTLKRQLLAFPTGRNDVPNALAYALLLRPGAPKYPEFDETAIVFDRPLHPGETIWLLINSDALYTTAIAVLYHHSKLTILLDWCVEGQPVGVIPALLKDIALALGRPFRTVINQSHNRLHDIIGLRPALRHARVEPDTAGDAAKGAVELHGLFSHKKVSVALKAKWTLRALTESHISPYTLLLESLEGFVARALPLQQREQQHYEYTKDGRRYVSAMP